MKPPRIRPLAVLGLVLLIVQAKIDEAQELLDKGLLDPNATEVVTTTVPPPPSIPTVAQNASALRVPQVYGMRIELPPNDPFGYNDKTICVVGTDVSFKVVIYGNHIDKIEALYFTVTDNCSDPDNVKIEPSNDFTMLQPHKGSFMIQLKPVPIGDDKNYKLCVKKPNIPLAETMPVEDKTLWLTTELPPKVYLLPLPVQIGVIIFLLCLSALFSGLTLGLMSLTPMELELVQKSGSKSEQRYASAILPIRKKGNQLLCALLLGNVIVNASISILFGELTTGMIALAVSSFGIVVFGEIIPQSICVKKGLAVGAHTISITQFFMFVTYPVAWPIAKFLDCILGEEYEGYDRKRLMELMKFSMKENGQLSDELKIAVGAMEIADKIVEDVMTKIDDVFMLPDTTVLNARTMAEIVRIGYSRIPVFSQGDRNNVTDLLFVKDLALLDPEDNFTARTVCGYHQHQVKFVFNNTPLAVLLENFKKGDGHLAMVKRVVEGTESSDPAYQLVGLVTLEDIVEEILQAEIVDEFDTVTDNKSRVKRRTPERGRDLSKYFEKEAPTTHVSSHLQMVTLQYLVSNESALTERYINKNVLERLIATSAKRVDMSYLTSAGGDSAVSIPKLAKLYTKDELSDKYILILEGRAQVTIGQGGMMFEAGPFHRFGSEILERLMAAAGTLSRSNSIVEPTAEAVCRRPDLMFKPDYSVVITDVCTYLEITISSFINAYRSSLMLKDREEALHFPGSALTSRTSSESSISGIPTPLPIEDPSAVVISDKPERRISVVQAREAVEALNAREQEHKSRPPVDEAEMELLNHQMP